MGPDLEDAKCITRKCRKCGETAEETDPLLQHSDVDFGITWLRTLSSNYSWRYLVMMLFGKHFIFGLSVHYNVAATPFVLKAYGVDGPHFQVLKSVIYIPWALKPVYGLLSDTLPICGYNKAPYMLACAIGGGISLLIVGIVPRRHIAIGGVVVCLILSAVQMSLYDLLFDAKNAEKINQMPKYGPDLISFQYFGISILGIGATLTAGVIIPTIGPNYCFLLAGIPALFVFFPVYAGYMDEKLRSAEETREIRRRVFRQKEVPVLVFIVFCSSLVLSMSGLYPSLQVNGIVSICVAATILTSFSLALAPIYAKFIAFIFLVTVFDFSTKGAAFYFYTDAPTQYPEGPHFSNFFYVSVLGTVQMFCSCVGVILYRKYLKAWKYRNLFIFFNIAKAIFSTIDTLVFARVTRKIGIPDHLCVLGMSILEDFLFMFLIMSITVLFAGLCPKGMEAIMSSFLASSYWLGNSINNNIGAWILKGLHAEPTGAEGESAQFENLWMASAIAAALQFTIVFVLLPLVPDARNSEHLSLTELDVTSGSIMQTYFFRKNEPHP